MSLPDAISAMLIYRLVSWIFISAIGWVVFFFNFRTESHVDLDDAPGSGTDPRGHRDWANRAGAVRGRAWIGG